MKTHKTVPSFRLLLSFAALWLAALADCQAVTIHVSLRLPGGNPINERSVSIYDQVGRLLEHKGGDPAIDVGIGCYNYGPLPDDPAVQGWYYDESAPYSTLTASFDLPESMIGKKVSFRFPASPYPGIYTGFITVQSESFTSEQLFLTETSPPTLTEINTDLVVSGNAIFSQAVDIYGSLLNLGTDPASESLLFNWTAERPAPGTQSFLRSRSNFSNTVWSWEAPSHSGPSRAIMKLQTDGINPPTLKLNDANVLTSANLGSFSIPSNLNLEGSLGVGTDAPQEKLHVLGNILIEQEDTPPNDTTNFAFKVNTSGSSSLLLEAHANQYGNNEFSIRNLDGGEMIDRIEDGEVVGRERAGVAWAFAVYDSRFGDEVDSDGQKIHGDDARDGKFAFNVVGVGDAFALHRSRDAIFYGRLGIGFNELDTETIEPAGRLHVLDSQGAGVLRVTDNGLVLIQPAPDIPMANEFKKGPTP